MKIRKYEDQIRKKITDIIKKILKDNLILNITAKTRVGAEISNYLENKFIEYTKGNTILVNNEQTPKNKTKNPWDARTFYNYNNHLEEIWIDFKAFKVSSTDSNPDIGTPKKVIAHILSGSFYILYIHIYYEEHNNGLIFKPINNEYVKSYFLKDISNSFRRTPTNQLQVNINAKPAYRTRKRVYRITY